MTAPTPETTPTRDEAVRAANGDNRPFPNYKVMPDPTDEMLASPQFEAIWNVIKSWDVNVPEAYSGYCGANGLRNTATRTPRDLRRSRLMRSDGMSTASVRPSPRPRRRRSMMSCSLSETTSAPRRPRLRLNRWRGAGARRGERIGMPYLVGFQSSIPTLGILSRSTLPSPPPRLRAGVSHEGLPSPFRALHCGNEWRREVKAKRSSRAFDLSFI